MKISNTAWFVFTAAILAGCASTRPGISAGGYSFEFGDSTYRIESMTPRARIGYNTLVLREGERSVVLGIDKDQNGSLDEVVQKGMALEEAQRIYTAGILEGEKQGLVRSRTPTKDFTIVINDKTCILSTYILTHGEIYNRLTILSSATGGKESVLLDAGSDGRLDKIEKGDGNMEDYQTLYDKVIERGLTYGKVERSEGRYVVIM